jgi:hypothetical protein
MIDVMLRRYLKVFNVQLLLCPKIRTTLPWTSISSNRTCVTLTKAIACRKRHDPLVQTITDESNEL